METSTVNKTIQKLYAYVADIKLLFHHGDLLREMAGTKSAMYDVCKCVVEVEGRIHTR